MNNVNKEFYLKLFVITSLLLCNIIYENVFNIISNDGHHHSEYSIVWAPNAYMVFFLCAFYNNFPKTITTLTLFMTIIGFNLIYFNDQNYPIGMGTYSSSLIMYAVNNLIFILGFFIFIRLWESSSLSKRCNEIISYIIIHIVGFVCTLAASFSVVFFPSSSMKLVFQLFSANMMTFTFFTSYLFLMEKFISNNLNAKMINFSLLIIVSSLIFYVINIFLHDMSKETFALILMASFISLFIKINTYIKLLIISFVSAIFAAVNITLDLLFYDFILFYCICISTSVILMMRKQEASYLEELKTSVDELEKSRLMDPLTGALNREGFQQCLKNICSKNVSCLVAYADLDKFKEINDMMGHRSGDKVLKIVTSKIKHILGNQSNVARMGGDEFAFIITGEKNYAIDLCQCILDSIKKPITIGEYDVSIGISIGVCLFPNQDVDPDGLINKADIAMFVAKRSRARTPICFEDHMDHRKSLEAFNKQRKFNIENLLSECYSVYQPIHNIKNKNILSFEALLRHPTFNTIDIINWAEEYGYMDELFEMMINNSVKVINKTGHSVTINISPSQLLFNGLAIESLIKRKINENKIQPFHLNIEITESIPILDQELFLQIIKRIKALNVKIYLDDFGTGYAFFSTLSIGAFDAIKIDRNLVYNIHNSQSVQRLLSSIICYASSTNMYIVAEGVESIEELNTLESIGVIYVQGYFFSKPLNEDEITNYLNKFEN